VDWSSCIESDYACTWSAALHIAEPVSFLLTRSFVLSLVATQVDAAAGGEDAADDVNDELTALEDEIRDLQSELDDARVKLDKGAS
jgi:fructoselysine-6-P-deglycase FrlB-like protein